MFRPKELEDTLLGSLEPPSPEQRAKVAKPFKRGYRNGSPFEKLVLAIDMQLRKSGRKFRRTVRDEVITRVIIEMRSRGITDGGLGMIKTSEGMYRVEELFNQRQSFEISPSTVVDDAAQEAPPAAEQSLSGSSIDYAVSPNTGLSKERIVAASDRTRLGPIRHRYRVLRYCNRSTILDSPRQFMTCLMCGNDHILIPIGGQTAFFLSPLIDLTGRVYSTQLRHSDLYISAARRTWAITVENCVIEVPQDLGARIWHDRIGVLETLTAGILVWLWFVIVCMASGNAPQKARN